MQIFWYRMRLASMLQRRFWLLWLRDLLVTIRRSSCESSISENRCRQGLLTNRFYFSRPSSISRRYWCPENGCLNRSGRTPTFSRKADLMRHVHNFHKDSPTYPCPVGDCDGFSSRRLDKLNEHLQKKHGIPRTRCHRSTFLEGMGRDERVIHTFPTHLSMVRLTLI